MHTKKILAFIIQSILVLAIKSGSKSLPEVHSHGLKPNATFTYMYRYDLICFKIRNQSMDILLPLKQNLTNKGNLRLILR